MLIFGGLVSENLKGRLLSTFKANNKHFFNYIKIIKLETVQGGIWLKDDEKMVEKLDTFFASVFTEENVRAVSILELLEGTTGKVTRDVVLEQQGKLKMSKSPYPTGVYPIRPQGAQI